LQQAREQLRRRGVRASVGELALTGAQVMLADGDARATDAERRAKLRSRLARRLRSGEGIDADALREAREHGWTRA
jgi:hypothetical protein